MYRMIILVLSRMLHLCGQQASSCFVSSSVTIQSHQWHVQAHQSIWVANANNDKFSIPDKHAGAVLMYLCPYHYAIDCFCSLLYAHWQSDNAERAQSCQGPWAAVGGSEATDTKWVALHAKQVYDS